MRIYILWVLVAACFVYAWKDWFVTACVLVVLSFVMQREDFPQYLFGVNGLNPWNVILLATFCSWVLYRIRSAPPFDLPRTAKILMVCLVGMIGIAYIRAAGDLQSMAGAYIRSERVVAAPSFIGFTGDFLINRIKFLLPALFIFDGARTRKRVIVALSVALLTGFCYAALTIKTVEIQSLFSNDFMKYRHRFDRDIGLNPIDLSMLLAGMFWALVAYLLLLPKQVWQKVVLVAPLSAMFLGMALCQSRGSYFGFAATGIVFGVARYRKLLVAFPIIVVALFVAFPAIPARLTMGFGEVDVGGEKVEDWDVVSAGRVTDLWPAAIEQIGKDPLLGFGGEASVRTELRKKWAEHGVPPGHPHNAYLELLLDMGVVGFVPIMILYVGIWVTSWKLFRDRSDPLIAAVGGAGLAGISTLMVTALACQSFYPTQSSIPLWICWALVMRIWVERRRVAAVQAQRSHETMVAASGRAGVPHLVSEQDA